MGKLKREREKKKEFLTQEVISHRVGLKMMQVVELTHEAGP